MKVEDETYLPVNEEGNSVFEIPVPVFDEPVTVIGDTTAMSVPHEIEYTLTVDSASISQGEQASWYNNPVFWAGAAVAAAVPAAGNIRKTEEKGCISMKRIKLLGIATVLLLLLGGCGRTETAAQERNTDISQELTYTGSMDLVYAEKFAVDYYEDGYALITVNQDMQYLLVPEGMEAPLGPLQRSSGERMVYRRGQGSHGSGRYPVRGEIFHAGL